MTTTPSIRTRGSGRDSLFGDTPCRSSGSSALLVTSVNTVLIDHLASVRAPLLVALRVVAVVTVITVGVVCFHGL